MKSPLPRNQVPEGAGQDLKGNPGPMQDVPEATGCERKNFKFDKDLDLKLSWRLSLLFCAP